MKTQDEKIDQLTELVAAYRISLENLEKENEVLGRKLERAEGRVETRTEPEAPDLAP